MPSLQALRDFSSSFRNIGGEISVLAEKGTSYEELEFPDHESAAGSGPASSLRPEKKPVPSSADSTDLGLAYDDEMDLGSLGLTGEPGDFGDIGIDSLNLGETPGTPAEIEGDDESGDIDFGAFLDTIPDDLPIPGTEDTPGGSDFGDLPGFPEEAEALPEEILAAEEPAISGEGDFGLPDGLLDGLADDLEAAPGEDEFFDLGGEEGIPDPDSGIGMEDSSLDLGGEEGVDELAPLEDLSPVEDVPLVAKDDESGDFEGFDLGGETDASAGDEDLESLSFDEAEGQDSALDAGFDLGNEESLDLGGDAGVFEMGGEAGFGEELVPMESGSGDTWDSFNPSGAALPDDIDFNDTSSSGSGAFGGMDDFALSGIDDVFGSNVPLGTPVARARLQPEASEEVEEISLTDEELQQLQGTLAAYPLNLRIACEELIAEQAVAPEQMSRLIKLLVKGASAKETAVLAGNILGKTITIPKGFEKKTGEALEAEQASFPYIFVHKFLPALGLFFMIALVASSLVYLVYQFIYKPMRAETIYKAGLERIDAGEYQRANERFNQAFRIHRKKEWFYRYAEAFRDKRQYRYAEEKYDELLTTYFRDKKGVLDYAHLETYYLRNYSKAETLLQRIILDYHPNDPDALLTLGDNALAWGEVEKERYEDARFAYARILELYGWKDFVVERMMKYFIRTDQLKEVIPLQVWFDADKKRKISADTLAELGGYYLDKKTEEVRGVPDEWVQSIEGIRDILLRALRQDTRLPEGYYHLARYYHYLGNTHEERQSLEAAIKAFELARKESVCRLCYQIDAHQMYGTILIDARQSFPAEETLLNAAELYEDAVARKLIPRSARFGRIYADLGNLEYFAKSSDMEMALSYYEISRQDGYAPPEILYRMGGAHYQLKEWGPALESFFSASAELPLNRRILYSLGNAAHQRGDFHTSQAYYSRLLDLLENERSRLPEVMPNDRPEYIELAERLMIARNNMGVTLESLALVTGDTRYRSRALGLYAESDRAWDALSRDPVSMIRSGAGELSTPGINLAYLNSRNALYPQPSYEAQLYLSIDKDAVEPSLWEELYPPGRRLSE
ncbi:MAG: tetratricopeptide repeat protein [Treponema sp.]|jgi:tetratricopeptide (TPR) repeat protein|nr:tetratricopeptide repeat protein [Treponema sp.]